MSDRYRAAIHQSSSALQSIPNAVLTAITMDTLDYDNGSLSDLGTYPTRLTVPANVAPGTTHIVVGNAVWSANARGYREVMIAKNGSLLIESENFTNPPGSGGMTHQAVYVDPNANPGDYYEVWGYQTSGGALSTAEHSGLQLVQLG